MAEKEYLYWSHIEAYEECPQKFLWKHGWGVIDLGRGPGKGKLIKEKRSEHNAVMGNVLSYAIERLYNDELWRTPPSLVRLLTESVEKDFAIRMAKAYIKYDEDWTPGGRNKWDESPPKEILLQTCIDGILNYLRTMKRNKLLGPYAKSEVDLSGFVDKYTKIAGRPDLVIRREDTGVTIIDGKNAANPGKYTNADQLKWYALCFWIAYHSIPNRLAFAYFRFPEGSPPKEVSPKVPYEGKPEDWTGLVEVSCTKDDLKLLAHRAVSTRKVMLKEFFDPTPSSKSCTFCDFKNECSAYSDHKAAHARKPKAPMSELETQIEESTGLIRFGGNRASSKP